MSYVPYDPSTQEEQAEEAAYWAAEAARHEYAEWVEQQALAMAEDEEEG